MNKRIQIPVAKTEAELLKRAARRAGLPLAEWARRLLRAGAAQELGAGGRTPGEALDALCALDAPVADVDTMIEESTRGRYP
ncbi:MAG: hypothetical protein ACC662_11130 [Planctomycetota bacterium]